MHRARIMPSYRLCNAHASALCIHCDTMEFLHTFSIGPGMGLARTHSPFPQLPTYNMAVIDNMAVVVVLIRYTSGALCNYAISIG